jgi:hypothetical protein
MRTPSRILVGCAALLGLSLTAQPAKAGFTVELTVTNESNVSNALTGVYATVEGHALSLNSIQFTVTPNDLLWGAGNTVKVFQFGFNNSASTGNLTFSNLPTGWASDGTGNMDGFGSFISRVGDNGQQDDVDPLIFTVTTANAFGSNSALEAAFQNDNAEGHEFAAHMRGFSFNGTTSAFFTDGDTPGGGVEPTPAPAGILLLASAIPVLGLRRILRRKTA